MNAMYYNFYYPPHEHIEFSTNNLIANVGSLFLKPGRAVFGKKVVVFDKDNIPSVKTIESSIKHPIAAVALRIILWIPTYLGNLFLELARATSTPFETKMWEARKACIMDILNHSKWKSWEERKVTASKICSWLSYNQQEALADKLYGEYSTKRDEMAGSQAAFMRNEVMSPRAGLFSWKPSDVVKLEELRFESMSDEAVVKWASLAPSLVDVLCDLPLERQKSILNRLEFDKKIVELLSSLSKKRYLKESENQVSSRDYFPTDSRPPLVEIVNKRFANHIIDHQSSLATVIDEFKDYPSIDLSWIFTKKHLPLLKNLLKLIGHDQKNEKWLFNLFQSAFNTHNLDILLTLLTKEQIVLFYQSFPHNYETNTIHRIRKESFTLILKYKDIQSKLNPSKYKIYNIMQKIYSSYPENFFPDKKSRNQKEYEFLFSPCDGEIESLRNIPYVLLKIYLYAVKKLYVYELSQELSYTISYPNFRQVFQFHSIPPDLMQKIQELRQLKSDIQEELLEMMAIILAPSTFNSLCEDILMGRSLTEPFLNEIKAIARKRNEYFEHFNSILYLDECVFLKIYDGFLTNEERAYISKSSHQKKEKASTYLPSSLQIMCTKFLHENPRFIKQEKCHQDLEELIETYRSLRHDLLNWDGI